MVCDIANDNMMNHLQRKMRDIITPRFILSVFDPTCDLSWSDPLPLTMLCGKIQGE